MEESAAKFALRGQTMAFRGDPFEVGAEAAVTFDSDGAVIVADGRIVEIGHASELLGRHPRISVDNWRDHLIMAGFIDSHAHYPQTEVIASYGAQLIEWLHKYTFPAEQKFADADYALQAANGFLEECLRNGVTTASVFCTVHPQSVDAFFTASKARGLRMVAGKVMMDRNAPSPLTDTAQRGYEEAKGLIARWHGASRLSYAVTPRFAPTSTPAQLEAAGALWREHPTTLVQTHMSENRAEIAWVKELFPDAPDYLGVYQRYGLAGPGANFGHAIHLTDREVTALRETGAGLSHCPTSNTFIGSGLFDLQRLREGLQPVPVGLGTDVGGGSSFSMFATMRAAYEVAQLRGYSLHPVKAFYLATLGGAKVLRMEHVIGNLVQGHEADIVVLDLNSRPLIAERMRHARDLADTLFVQMILADDRAIAAVYSGGSKVYQRATADKCPI
jgi:guanine deaminase